MNRRLLTLLVAMVSLAIVVSSAWATRVIVYSPLDPYTENIAAGIHIVAKTTGYCTAPARSTPHRADTWLCIETRTGDSYDPCYAPSGQSIHEWVVCPAGDLGTGRFIRINLTHPLPAHGNPAGDPTADDPTMVQLTNGNTCWLISDGYAGVVAGLRIEYRCGAGAWLVGPVRRGRPNWTSLYLPTIHSMELTPTTIAVAYF